MVRDYGLSQALGPVSYGGPPGLAASRSYSERTQWLVDQEVTALLTQAETRARDLLTSHQEALTQLTAAANVASVKTTLAIRRVKFDPGVPIAFAQNSDGRSRSPWLKRN